MKFLPFNGQSDVTHAVCTPLQGPGHITHKARRNRWVSQWGSINQAEQEDVEPEKSEDAESSETLPKEDLRQHIALDEKTLKDLQSLWMGCGKAGFELGDFLLEIEALEGWRSEYTPNFTRFLEHEGLHAPTARMWMKASRILVRMLRPDPMTYLKLCQTSLPALGMLATLFEDFPQMLLAASLSNSRQERLGPSRPLEPLVLPASQQEAQEEAEEDYSHIWEDAQERSLCLSRAQDVLSACDLPEAEFRQHIEETRQSWMIQGALLSNKAQGRLDVQELIAWRMAVQRRHRYGNPSEEETDTVQVDIERILARRARQKMNLSVGRVLRQFSELSLAERQLFMGAARGLVTQGFR